MNKINLNSLKEYVEREGLRLLKESQASSNLEDTIEDLDAGLIQLYHKKFDKLKSEEKKAIEKEDFSSLKSIKEQQADALRKLIKLYEKKVEYLNKLGEEIEASSQEVGSKGVGIFSNKSLNEFKNESFLKGNKVKMVGGDKYFVAEKASDNNVYKVLETNIDGIESGDVLKISDAKIGGHATVTVYRKMGDRFEELKTMKFNNVSEIIKNPA
ncbi:MAG: hypothetical protein KatS3mg035_1148 [Bacteroidia bacterium]|nr:MAG: hypothetical protein KatS3mg035_1148 [Bacteroidia bacterium]